MIEIEGLSKRFGAKPVLDHVSFTAEDGKVTGFLGPNGAGKSTTIRVDEVMDLTGIAAVKTRKAGAFSLGMSQRLSIAAALLGDPHNLVLDEPINGLDPEGVKWVRDLCRYYAAQGRAVLLSSHLMSEVALTADNLVIIGQGRILETTTVADFVAEHSTRSLRVITPEPEKLKAIFAHAPEVTVTPITRETGDPQEGAAFRITGADLGAAACVFAAAQLVTYLFVQEHASLEEAYMTLTHSRAEYLGRAMPVTSASSTPPVATNVSESEFAQSKEVQQ